MLENKALFTSPFLFSFIIAHRPEREWDERMSRLRAQGSGGEGTTFPAHIKKNVCEQPMPLKPSQEFTPSTAQATSSSISALSKDSASKPHPAASHSSSETWAVWQDTVTDSNGSLIFSNSAVSSVELRYTSDPDASSGSSAIGSWRTKSSTSFLTGEVSRSGNALLIRVVLS